MIEISDLIFVVVMLIFFILHMVGTKLRWKILVDPPESWKGYSHTFLKRVFGTDFLIIYNYIVGVLGTSIGIIILFQFLKKYFAQN